MLPKPMFIINILKNKAVRKPIILAWTIAIIISGAVPIVTGQIYGAEEAKQLLEFVQRASLYYGSAVMTASATILALILTVLGLTTAHMKNPDKTTFVRLHAIAAFCVYAFIASVFLLLMSSLPVDEFEKIPSDWYRFAYYVICFWNGMLAGYIISAILILRDTASNIIANLSPDFDEEGEKDSSSE